MVGATVAGGATVAVGAPLVLTALGFTAAGIAAHSVAAGTMSVVYATGVGLPVLASLQSAGAAGVGAATFFSAAAVTGGAAAVSSAGSCQKPHSASEKCD